MKRPQWSTLLVYHQTRIYFSFSNCLYSISFSYFMIPVSQRYSKNTKKYHVSCLRSWYYSMHFETCTFIHFISQLYYIKWKYLSGYLSIWFVIMSISVSIKEYNFQSAWNVNCVLQIVFGIRKNTPENSMWFMYKGTLSVIFRYGFYLRRINYKPQSFLASSP